MNVGPQTNGHLGGPSHDDVFFRARKQLRLHMRERDGYFMRGRDVWYDRRMSLPRQRAMLELCLRRLAARTARLKPLRNASARKRTAA